ncbi:PAS domain-containing protein [Paracidovorax wautersii]|uniref:histidine kinase n=1 Tax=Paracidovorax wautersii TaxID=1177982 RepID=A0ABU1I717_9BURK|nr:PAS domain-containing protein [Paracidovorax wautersii]MDR6213010.1 signal transduction histidine kinase/CheY-like chemotaxis protein [Paracidovorax wautersii]
MNDRVPRPGPGGLSATAPHFLPDGTPTHPLLSGTDWAHSSLGDPAAWPRPLRAAVSQVMDSVAPMWLAWGPRLGMVYNGPYADMLGGKHPRAMGAPLDAVWAEVWPDVGELVATTLAGQALYREDLPLVVNRRGHDEPAWFSFSYTPLRDEDGRVQGVLCTVWETTDKMLAQRQLAESESRLKALTLATANAVYRMNADWSRLLEVNGQGFVADTAEPTAHWVEEYVAPEDRDRVRAAIAEAMATRGLLELEHRVYRVDGSIGWVLSRAMPLLDAQGEVTEWFGTATDLTARKATELALYESERQLRTLFETIDEGFCVIEFLDGPHGPLSDYVHVSANPAYQANAGIANVVGQRVRDMVPQEADAWVEIYRKVLVTGEPVRFERELVKTGRYLELAAFRVEPVERRQVAVLFQDVTQRHRAERALRELNNELEQRVASEVAERLKTEEALRQAQKMEAVGQLTGGIAHDFNNMLAVVLGSLELLDRRFAAGEPRAKRYIDAARDGARRAAQLTQRLLAFSRRQPLSPVPLDANQLVAGMSDMLRHSLGGAIRLETVLAGGLWRIHADRNQLESVILNLAVNGRDAMGDLADGGGRLTIETANAHLDERYAAEHLGVAPGQYVLIAVSDTGAGMPPEVIAKAFDPFFTTKEVGKGTGLGLSQVYGFIKQSSGHVKIYSEVGAGTTVKVYLPRRVDPALEEEAAAGGDAALPRGDAQEWVLVVEDEPAVRQLSVDALGLLGYRVLEADGAAAALKLIDAHPEIALLFTDVVMPDVNGRKLAEEALRRRPQLKVLFTTGYTRNAVVHNGVLDAGVRLIGKPYTLEDLAVRVREALDAPHTGLQPAGS